MSFRLFLGMMNVRLNVMILALVRSERQVIAHSIIRDHHGGWWQRSECMAGRRLPNMRHGGTSMRRTHIGRVEILPLVIVLPGVVVPWHRV